MALKSIANSIILSRDDSEDLTRVFGAPTDADVWTFSAWVKLGRQYNAASSDPLFTSGDAAGDATDIYIDDNGKLHFRHIESFSTTDEVISTAEFLDHTAWYHIVVRYDATQVTDSDRIRFYVNGVQLVDFDTANWPALNDANYINSNGDTHTIGGFSFGPSDTFDGYMSDVYFLDGQSVGPETFGEANGDAWQPITASPTYGSNGFLLEFGTDSALGDDTSGNVNDFTLNGGIVASNQREDSPSQNHLTFNQDYYATTNGIVTLRQGSRQLLAQNASYVTAAATAALPKTGKYYWEVDWAAGATAVDKVVIGIINQGAALNGRIGDDDFGWGLYNPSGTVIAYRHNGADNNFTDTGAFAVGDYFMVAYDTATGNLWFGRNGTWLDSGNPETGANPAVTLGSGTGSDRWDETIIPAAAIITTNNRLDFRSSSEDFEGTIPNGFKELRVDQWPKPDIEQPSQYFDAYGYAGNSSNPRSLTGNAFQPDLAWVKNWDSSASNIVGDVIKGGGVVHINEAANMGADKPAHTEGDIAAFISDGITVDAVSGEDVGVNDSADTYIALFWKEGAAPGLDIVGYTGTAASQAISHSLGAVPDIMYVRNRDSEGGGEGNEGYWRKRKSTATTVVSDPETDAVPFDTTSSVIDDSTFWNDTAPTTTQFTVGTQVSVNTDGDEHQAYLWREIDGFSKFTSFTGSGTADEEAPFVYTNFRPKCVVVRRNAPNGFNWFVFLRDSNNVVTLAGDTTANEYFTLNSANAATSASLTGNISFHASGFKIADSWGQLNQANAIYMVMAFAEVPFAYATGFTSQKIGDGDIEMPLELGGTGDNPNQYGDGDVSLNFVLSGSGDNGGRKRANGSVDLSIELGGTGTKGVSPLLGTGAVDFGPFELDGQGFNTAMRGQDSEYPVLTTNGTIVQGFEYVKQGTTHAPLTVNGTITDSLNLTGNPRIPLLATNGDINPDMDAELPALTASGTILPGATLRGTLELPRAITTTGTLINEGATSGGAILPLLTLTDASGNVSTIVSGNFSTGGTVTLPALTGNGTLFIPQEMSGSLVLPAVDVDRDAILAPGAIATGSVTLPLLRLEGVLVNGDTLAATVWAVNTETFETTNYSNYPFHSLVSFQGQPYGVTSSGIFLLEGADDDGTQIDAQVLTGISDRGIEDLKEITRMYLYGSFNSMVFQLYPDGQVRVREYDVIRRSNSSGTIHGRAKGARGLRTRSIQFGFRNQSGGDFTIDKVGLLERILTRKTRKN